MDIVYVWPCALGDYGRYNLLLINEHNCSSFPLMVTSSKPTLHMAYNTCESLVWYLHTVYSGAYSSAGALWLLYSNKCTVTSVLSWPAAGIQLYRYRYLAPCHSSAVCVQSHSIHKQHFMSSINKLLTIEIKSIIVLHAAGETNFISHDSAYTQHDLLIIMSWEL